MSFCVMMVVPDSWKSVADWRLEMDTQTRAQTQCWCHNAISLLCEGGYIKMKVFVCKKWTAETLQNVLHPYFFFLLQCQNLGTLEDIYEGRSESNAPHFFLGNYLLRMFEIHAQYNWMFPLHMLFFHIISTYVYGLTPARNNGMHSFPVPACSLFM
jgi:hypothetical protein